MIAESSLDIRNRLHVLSTTRNNRRQRCAVASSLQRTMTCVPIAAKAVVITTHCSVISAVVEEAAARVGEPYCRLLQKELMTLVGLKLLAAVPAPVHQWCFH